MIGSIMGPIIGLTAPGGGGAPSGLLPDYKWTNNYIAGAGGVQTLVADIGGVDFTQSTTVKQPTDGGTFLTFDGAGDFMDSTLTDTDVLDNLGVAGEMTMMVRVDGTGTSNSFDFIMGSSEGGNPERLYLLRNNSAADVWGFGAFDMAPSVPVVSDSATLALVIANGTAKGYIDGIEVASVSIVQTSGTGNPFKLGTAGGATSYFKGNIYESRIYTKELNASQVLTAYNEMNP